MPLTRRQSPMPLTRPYKEIKMNYEKGIQELFAMHRVYEAARVKGVDKKDLELLCRQIRTNLVIYEAIVHIYDVFEAIGIQQPAGETELE